MRKIGIIGAGQTGRGFLARLLDGQAEIVFADKDQSLIDRLTARGEYAIRFFGDEREPVLISNYSAHHISAAKAALSDCAAIFISVRAENTSVAGRWVMENVGCEIPVVVCENASDPAGLLDGTGLRAASGAIFCTTMNDGDVGIASENFPTLYASQKNAPKFLHSLTGFTLVEDFDTLMKRKLYTYNAASGIIAYLGAQRGFTNYADAANDPYIARALTTFYKEINRAVCLEYGTPPDEQRAFASLSLKKFQNRAIKDTISRNAMSPERKLGVHERILEPMRLIEAHGGNASPLYETAQAALAYAGATTSSTAQPILLSAGLTPTDARMTEILARFDGE